MKDIARNFIRTVLLSCSASFLCLGCSIKHQGGSQTAFYSQSDSKLRQKATFLQKKLEKAQRTLSEDEKSIERIRAQLCEAELNAIESKVESFENQWRTDPQRLIQSIRPEFSKVFFEERETLNRIIRIGIDIPRAQTLLDRVLLLITELSDFVSVKDL